MAVLVRSEIPGLTSELYDSLIAQMEPGVKAAPGFVARIAIAIPADGR
jgi:hypothetical protein